MVDSGRNDPVNAEDDKPEAISPGTEQPVVWRFLGKWLLVSVGVLVVLVLIENVLVEIKEQPQASDANVIENLLVESKNKPQTSDGKRSFETYGEFITYQESHGYVFLGRFQDAWPAEIAEERTSMNEISFKLSNGTRRKYANLDGYELKLVRLATSQGTEAVVVLRSAVKQ